MHGAEAGPIGVRVRRTLRTAFEIAKEEYRDIWTEGDADRLTKRIFERAKDGTLIHWREGNIICSDSLMLAVYKWLCMINSIRRRPMSDREIIDALPGLVLFFADGEPTVEQIEWALLRVLQNKTKKL